MSLINSMYPPGFEQLHDPLAIQRSTIQRMSGRAPGANLLNLRAYDPANIPKTPSQPQSHSSFVKRCSQLAHGRRKSIQSTLPSSQAPTVAQWVQRLPSHPSRNEDFLESALEQVVGKLVCGPHVAAEEVEMGYNYDLLDDTVPEAWVHVQAKNIEIEGRTWIQASITSKAEPYERPEVYAYGRWQLVNTGKKHHS